MSILGGYQHYLENPPEEQSGETVIEEEASPDIVLILATWVSYNSIRLNLYLKLFSLSTAEPKCIKFSKWYPESVTRLSYSTLGSKLLLKALITFS